eukprot:TRINITY_DN16051_c0_g1_i1.p1 TRINITY_DN16051_c0_g1~~TRINITY_DN16051_c0_g1_i1.p1  ORF type:complete len:177 (+),score=21.11 TRINITY_DN16051_c0_g1_i1:39-569(+)
MPTAVILSGGPFAGKTRRCRTHHKALMRVTVERSGEGPARGPSLHAATKQLIRFLREGHNVVLDGENGSGVGRAALIVKLRAAVPDLRIVGEFLEPRGGADQAQWQRGWALAEGLVVSATAPSDAPPESPAITEGYDSLCRVTTPLHANNSSQPYSHSALLPRPSLGLRAWGGGGE